MFKPNKRVRTEYKCPKCGKKLQINLMYFEKEKGKVETETVSGHWCESCRARITIKYKVSIKRNGIPKIKIFKVITDNKNFVKRFHILGWTE